MPINPCTRDLIGDPHEAATELTRAIRHPTGATEHNTAALNKRGGGEWRR